MNKPPFARALQRVLFDPLSWLHPQRLQFPPELIARSPARAAVNSLLLAAWQLEDSPVDLTPFARQWVRHWYRLPQTAYLIGCHVRRADLAWKGGLFSLPAWANSFTALDLPGKAALPAQRPLTHRDVMKTGYAQLLAWNKQLPEPLVQRFPLLFPAYVDSATAQPAVDPLLLLLALQHAQTYPNAPP